jgi:Universal stress protein family
MKILLATDGSKYSDAVAGTVASQLRMSNAEVLVLQVV